MLLSRLSLLLFTLLLIAGGGTALWRFTPITPSSAPVFSFPAAAARFDHPGDFAGPIKVYQADRGAECKLAAPDGTRLTLFCFEWDRLEAGPMMSLVGHAPEQCNVAAGFKLEEISANRRYQTPGQQPLDFDCTRFSDPAGRQVFMFRLAWLQGLGSRPLRIEGESRIARLKNSFIRHLGAARVLEAGVFAACDADHAWQVFCTQVLDQLQWR